MKSFLTSLDVEYMAARGHREILVDDDVVVTAVAEEAASRLGVRLVRVDGDRAGRAQEPSAAKVEPKGKLGHGISEEVFIDSWRREFPILEKVIHVGNCSQSPESRRVRNAVEAYLDNWLTEGMDWEYWIQEVYRAKVEFAKLIGVDPADVAVSTSVSEATASLASALDFSGSRRKVVATEAEFPTVGHVWLAHQKYGAKVEFVPVKDGRIRLQDYERYIDEDTLITSVTHVYYQNGFKQDISAIAEIAHRKGSLVYVDAYQSAGTVPINVDAMGIDVLATGNLKYLLGVPGIAFMYVRRELIPKLKPAVTGWFGQENPFSFKVHVLDYASTARRFDTGTPPVVAAFAARAGMEIINEVGVEFISRRIEMLSQLCIEGIKRRGLKLASPSDTREKGATTAIFVPDAAAMELELKRRNIIASARGNVIRVAPHFFTKPEEIDMVLDEISKILES